MFSKKNITIALIVLAVLLLGAGLVLFKKNNMNKPSLEQDAASQEQLNALNKAIDEARKTDTDQDGLSNEEEARLGTDPNTGDSDHDGLLDTDEINIYHSDPLKADTDGDGRKDGFEVLRGYSPTGPDKLEQQ